MGSKAVPSLNLNHIQNGKAALHRASEEGRDDIVQYLIDKHATISLDDAQHFKPIHYAAKNGHINVFEKLARAGENINVLTTDGANHSPLHLAAEYGHLDMVISLIQHGANDQLQTDDNQVARDLAESHGHKYTAQYLRQVRPPATDHDWHTQILHRAIDQQNAELAHIALNNGAHMIDPDPDRTPLLRALDGHSEFVIGPADEMIAEILVRKGTPLNITDQYGNTPLHRVVVLKNIKLAELFLKCGADINAHEIQGRTALDIAIGAKTNLW